MLHQMNQSFEYNQKQCEACRLIAGHKHILLRGGSRSGKTFVFCRALLVRAAKAPGSRHVIFRARFNHVKHTIGMDTLPAVKRITAPNVPWELNRTDWVFNLPNGSEIWLAGLDDKERTEKILGSEYATIFFNEISQIGYQEVLTARTRLAQKAICQDGSILQNKCFYDCNPPSVRHWSYDQFIKRIDPVDGTPVGKDYITMQINPRHNIKNLTPDFITELEKLPSKQRERFLHGEYIEVVEGALWIPEMFQYYQTIPRLKRIVVAVDPTGSKQGDEVGIIGVGIDFMDNIYVLSDRSGHYTPNTWANIAVKELEALKGDAIVAERNFGGDMVKHTIRGASRAVRVIEVSASRGKDIRAEPVVAQYEESKVFHAPGKLNGMENEMLTWVPGEGKSPNRVDALVWGVTELVSRSGMTGGKFNIPKGA